jgi:hypothetical protein
MVLNLSKHAEFEDASLSSSLDDNVHHDLFQIVQCVLLIGLSVVIGSIMAYNLDRKINVCTQLMDQTVSHYLLLQSWLL